MATHTRKMANLMTLLTLGSYVMHCVSVNTSEQFNLTESAKLVTSMIPNIILPSSGHIPPEEMIKSHENLDRISNAKYTDSSRSEEKNWPAVHHRARRYLPIRLLGRPQPTTPHTPFMVAEANNNRYQYMPLKDDGTVQELDPCPVPSPPSGGGGSNVFALLTFSVVAANVLINAVANVNSNNNNNNNNENNNNDNANNENVSSNMDSNTNDNTIMGRALGSRSNSSESCSCSKAKTRARKKVPSETSSRFQMPKSLVSCAPRVICETSKLASDSSDMSYFLQSFSGLSTRAAVDSHFPPGFLRSARMLGLTGGNCETEYRCSLVDWIAEKESRMY
ncbi:uncharacterized protein [Palaemon carinicauda]|uniref:uncharacterized protein n=1 Tax=Palaemon carinicauda TaxID=392227 RepID=UPI0035B5FEC3